MAIRWSRWSSRSSRDGPGSARRQRRGSRPARSAVARSRSTTGAFRPRGRRRRTWRSPSRLAGSRRDDVRRAGDDPFAVLGTVVLGRQAQALVDEIGGPEGAAAEVQHRPVDQRRGTSRTCAARWDLSRTSSVDSARHGPARSPRPRACGRAAWRRLHHVHLQATRRRQPRRRGHVDRHDAVVPARRPPHRVEERALGGRAPDAVRITTSASSTTTRRTSRSGPERTRSPFAATGTGSRVNPSRARPSKYPPPRSRSAAQPVTAPRSSRAPCSTMRCSARVSSTPPAGTYKPAAVRRHPEPLRPAPSSARLARSGPRARARPRGRGERLINHQV